MSAHHQQQNKKNEPRVVASAVSGDLKLIPMSEVRRHNSRDDCWVVLHGKVYNLSPFLAEHPGGADVILKRAGKDGTAAFEPIHPTDILSTLPPGLLVGAVDPATVLAEDKRDETPTKKSSNGGAETEEDANAVPPLEHILNAFDFEMVARRVMKKEGWDYYSSGADDEITLRENHSAFHRIWLRPRVLVNVKDVDTSATMLGHRVSFPLYLTATALGKLAHPEGEVALTRAAHTHGLVQMLPTLASCSLEEMTGARQPGQVQFYQLYVNPNRQLTADVVKRAERLGCRALFITVDAPQLGRRERDMRNKFTDRGSFLQQKDQLNRNQGTARALSSFIDPSLCWDDIKWFQSLTSMPIVLKGIQTGEDAILAVQHGVQGIVVSNHGGRQLEFSRSGVEMLVEVMAALRSIGAEQKVEVFVDGGVRRGTDIFKCLALGAKAVGIGRPMLYALAGYGQPGVERLLQLLRDELELTMRLCGARNLAEIRPEMAMVNTLPFHVATVPADLLTHTAYVPLATSVPAPAPAAAILSKL